MRLPLSALVLGLLSACTSAETFQSEWAQSTCEWFERCDLFEVMGYDSTSDCADEQLSELIDSQEGEKACPDFNRSAANECVSEIEAKGCEGGFDQPSSCDEACP